MDNEIRYKKADFAINLSLFVNIGLAIIKSFTGVFGHSSALLADGINSTSDVVYLLFVKLYMKFASKPADKEHPYGHGQLESVASIIVGAFVITTAIAIFWDSVNRVYDYVILKPDNPGAGYLTLSIAVITVLIKIILSAYTKNIGKKYKSTAIISIAEDHRNDIFSALAATAGIVFSMIGYRWVDPFAGSIVAVFVLKTGLGIIRDSSDEIMSTNADKLCYKRIKRIAARMKEIKGIDELYIHSFGQYLMINITILVDENISVKTGDKIADKLESEIFATLEYVKKVNVHFHPGNSKTKVKLSRQTDHGSHGGR